MAATCDEYKAQVEEKIEEPIKERLKGARERCKKRKCKWWCACCNKWFCWIETFFYWVVRWVVRIILKWMVYIVCRVFMGLLTFGLTVLNILGWPVKWGWCMILSGDLDKLPTRQLQVEVVIIDKDDATPNPITEEEIDARISDADRILRHEARISVSRRYAMRRTTSAALYELDQSSFGAKALEWLKAIALLAGRDSPRYLTVYAIGAIKGAEAMHQPLFGSVFILEGDPETSLCHEIGHSLLSVLNAYHSKQRGHLMYVPWHEREADSNWPRDVPKLSRSERCTMRRSRWLDWSWFPFIP